MDLYAYGAYALPTHRTLLTLRGSGRDSLHFFCCLLHLVIIDAFLYSDIALPAASKHRQPSRTELCLSSVAYRATARYSLLSDSQASPCYTLPGILTLPDKAACIPHPTKLTALVSHTKMVWQNKRAHAVLFYPTTKTGSGARRRYYSAGSTSISPARVLYRRIPGIITCTRIYTYALLVYYTTAPRETTRRNGGGRRCYPPPTFTSTSRAAHCNAAAHACTPYLHTWQRVRYLRERLRRLPPADTLPTDTRMRARCSSGRYALAWRKGGRRYHTTPCPASLPTTPTCALTSGSRWRRPLATPLPSLTSHSAPRLSPHLRPSGVERETNLSSICMPFCQTPWAG